MSADKKKFAEDFVDMTKHAKLKAYQNLSQERPVTVDELKDFEALAKELYGIEV